MRPLRLHFILIEDTPVKRDALSSFADLTLTAAAMECRGTRLQMIRTTQQAMVLTKTWPVEATDRVNRLRLSCK